MKLHHTLPYSLKPPLAAFSCCVGIRTDVGLRSAGVAIIVRQIPPSKYTLTEIVFVFVRMSKDNENVHDIGGRSLLLDKILFN